MGTDPFKNQRKSGRPAKSSLHKIIVKNTVNAFANTFDDVPKAGNSPHDEKQLCWVNIVSAACYRVGVPISGRTVLDYVYEKTD